MSTFYLINNTTKQVVQPAFGYWYPKNMNKNKIFNLMEWEINHNIGIYYDNGKVYGLTENFKEVDLYEYNYENVYLCNITGQKLNKNYDLDYLNKIQKDNIQDLFKWHVFTDKLVYNDISNKNPKKRKI